MEHYEECDRESPYFTSYFPLFTVGNMEVFVDKAVETFNTHFWNINESLNVQNVRDSSLPFHFISKQFSSHQHNSNNRSRDTKYNNSLKSKGSTGYVKMSNKIMWNTNYKPFSYVSNMLMWNPCTRKLVTPVWLIIDQCSFLVIFSKITGTTVYYR